MSVCIKQHRHVFYDMSPEVPLTFKRTEATMILCLVMKCVYTKVSTYSHINCMSGRATYINWWTPFG